MPIVYSFAYTQHHPPFMAGMFFSAIVDNSRRSIIANTNIIRIQATKTQIKLCSGHRLHFGWYILYENLQSTMYITDNVHPFLLHFALKRTIFLISSINVTHLRMIYQSWIDVILIYIFCF